MLKKFKAAGCCVFKLRLLLIGVWLATSAYGRDGTDALPVIHYLGALPAQWEKNDSWSDVSKLQGAISQHFSQAVRESKRFAVLNDDLVASLWATPSGRKELARDYELHAFGVLNMAPRGDMVVMTMRLLSPDFDTWIQESDVVPRSWLIESDRDTTVARLGDLIHRLINRLPVDAHVTSVNGEFVTISAGSEQSLHIGEEFDVVSAKIKTLHPANGSWLSFDTARGGRIKVVESKGKSSIARITSLTRENAIVVGQGIRIEAISGRSRFARPDGGETFVNANTKDGGALVPEMRPDGTPHQEAAADSKVDVVDVSQPVAKPADSTDSAVKEPEQTVKNAEPPTSSSEDDGSAIREFLAPAGSDLNAYAGLRTWSLGGSGAASSALPLWLANSVGASIHRPLSDEVRLNYGIDAGYGPTAKGSFFAYGIHASGLYYMKMKLFDGVDHAFGGLEANIHTLSIGGETSGGFDMTSLNLLAGLHGATDSSLIGMRLDWQAHVAFALQESGRFGVSGNFEEITGGRGMLWRFLGYVGDRPKDSHQFGGGVEFGSGNYSLSSSKTATYNRISLLGLMRWGL